MGYFDFTIQHLAKRFAGFILPNPMRTFQCDFSPLPLHSIRNGGRLSALYGILSIANNIYLDI